MRVEAHEIHTDHPGLKLNTMETVPDTLPYVLQPATAVPLDIFHTYNAT